MADNETLIAQVFDAMVRHQPRLERFLGGEDDEDHDPRERADQLVKGFPYPIGVELRRLFAPEHTRPERGRLDQLFKTLERTLQYLSFVMLSQAVESPAPSGASLPPHVLERLVKPGGLSMGDFAYFVSALGDYFVKEGVEPFMPEMAAVLNRKFYAGLEFWAPERNEIGHYLINLTPEEIEKRCFEAGERLATLLADLAFLIKYPLVTMVEIRVEKTWRSPVRFSYSVKPLRSVSSNLLETAVCDSFTDNHAVLLLKSLRSPPGGFLNLSPLVIDTHNEVLSTREQVEKIKKDVFLFTKRDRAGQLHYLGTTVTEKCDLRPLAGYARLRQEFALMLPPVVAATPRDEAAVSIRDGGAG